MKKSICILFVLLASSVFSFSQSITGDTCITVGGTGNVVVFANYDGGVLNINIDQNIPNLKIGVCTYEPVTINLSGPFVNNITEVRYAGYVTTANNHCPNSPGTTTIVGAPGGATTSVNFLPAATLSNPNGYPMIVCGYSCDNMTNQGGCNTADQIQDYFTTTMGGSLYSYFTQYGCWSVAPYNVSAGSNCPIGTTTDTTITIFSSSSSAVCAGLPVNFTDLSPGATGWTWTAPGSSIVTSSAQNLSGVTWGTPGTYTVTLSTNDGTGNCSASQTITVLANPVVNATATDNTICNGDTTVVSATGAVSYTWTPAGPGNVNPSTDTWYYADGTAANGCTGTDSVFITVFPTPSAPTINYAFGILTASPAASSYQWYLNGTPIVGANNLNYTPTQNGNYSVSLTDANGCTSNQSAQTVVGDMGIKASNEVQMLNIYPNPGTGIFQINIPVSNVAMKVEVMDALGKVVYTKKLIINSPYMLDLTGNASGIYEVRISNGHHSYSGKLMIE